MIPGGGEGATFKLQILLHDVGFGLHGHLYYYTLWQIFWKILATSVPCLSPFGFDTSSHLTAWIFLFPMEEPHKKSLLILSKERATYFWRIKLCITCVGMVELTLLISSMFLAARGNNLLFQAANLSLTLSITIWKSCFEGLSWKMGQPRYFQILLVFGIFKIFVKMFCLSELTLFEIKLQI